MINSFRGEYGFLSNMYECSVPYRGETFRSSESAFQAAKSTNKFDFLLFVNDSGKSAKRRGRRIKLIDNWNNIRDDVMLEILRSKFQTNLNLATKLKETGDEELVEGNTWHDHYWGVCDGVGENKLGKLLMQVRSELMAMDTRSV